ncbi:MurR/RpiR family transcriptional regulator [Bacillaceae bacterium Marseille-Q3522]|nr:MurR/RpiR family transcriptional regulator [Bacillaceae bacterium Marseille-Q3522]
MNGVLYKVRESLESVKAAERAVAEFTLKHPEKVVSMTVKELAQRSFSSVAAIVRYCKSLGYEGFKDFKLKLAGDLTVINLHNRAKETLHPDDSIKDIIAVTSNNNIQSINDSMQLMNENDIQDAVQYLLQAKKIDFYGIGSSYLIASDAMQKFTRIGKICTAYSDYHMQKVSAVNLTSNDVIVAISYSGITQQIIDCVKIAQSRCSKVIAITKYADTPLSKLADITIFVAAKENAFRSAAMTSRIATLNVIDILYTACAHHNYADTLLHLKRTHQIIHND